jgi:hypothetical protein
VQCHRHVAAAEIFCPFCSAELAPSTPRHSVAAARLGRAAIFAGATVASACWTGPQANPDTTVHRQQQQVEAKAATIPPGTIRGVVRDDSGAYRPQYPVMLQDEHGKTLNATTDANGEFEFRGLATGNYTVYAQPTSPRGAPTQTFVTLQPEHGERADLAIYPPPVDRGPCCKPYGAPPARRRIV